MFLFPLQLTDEEAEIALAAAAKDLSQAEISSQVMIIRFIFEVTSTKALPEHYATETDSLNQLLFLDLLGMQRG